MKKKRFSVEQIVAVLKQAELGMPVADIIRQVGISEQTYYRWKKLYSGMQSDQVRELKQLQDENARLKKLVAELSLGQGGFAGRPVKKVPRPALKKDVVSYVVSHHGYSERRACRLAKQNRSVQKYRSVLDPRSELRQRMKEIASTRVRFGYRRIRVLLNREGWQAGKNLIYRLYKEEGLAIRKKMPRRRKMAVQRENRFKPQQANEVWSLDFVSDQLGNGQRFRALTVVDVFTWEALAIDVGIRLRGEHVVGTLNRLVAQRGKPKYLFADNGAEFTGRLMDMWAYHHGTRIDFSRPGKPTDNAFVETFNGSLRDECLNVNWFDSIIHAKQVIETWRQDYNESRPHMALGNASPSGFALLARDSGDRQNP